MKVAIFGFYKYCNFGDDLMAVMFARKIASLGHDPVVYGLNRRIAEQYSIDTVTGLDELMDGAQTAIIGGGGILVYKPYEQGSIFEQFRRDMFDFVAKAEDKNIPIGLFSIGGGTETSLSIPYHLGVARLVLSKQLNAVSLRRASDKSVFESVGCEVSVSHDVV